MRLKIEKLPRKENKNWHIQVSSHTETTFRSAVELLDNDKLSVHRAIFCNFNGFLIIRYVKRQQMSFSQEIISDILVCLFSIFAYFACSLAQWTVSLSLLPSVSGGYL